MSVVQQLLNICPDHLNKENHPETFSLSDFKCPTCNGQGFFDFSGYSQKFKKNIDDADSKECCRCNGTGMLQVKAVLKWMPADLPSKCLKQDG